MNLRSTANSNDDVEEKPPLRTRDIVIPLDAINLSFTRSSGAGGQNVNKVNTKVEIRFHVDSASWIPADWKDRLKQQQGNKINKEGELVVSSQEHR